MALTQLRYEALAVVTQVLTKLHTGGGTFRYATDTAEVEAASSDAEHRRYALILQTDPARHPLTGFQGQHLPDNSKVLARGIRMGGVLANTVHEGMEQIGRTILQLDPRLARAGAREIVVAEDGATGKGRRAVDRRYAGRPLGYGWLIDAGEDMHGVQRHEIVLGSVVHTIDLSLGAGGMLSSWRTEDGVLDQQHLNMGGGSVAAMGFTRGLQSGALIVHGQEAADFYPLTPRQGGDIWSPAMAGAPWHTPPPVAAHPLLAGGAPVLRATKSVGQGGTTTFDITTLPLDLDPDGRFWSFQNGVEPAVSLFAGGGYGRPVAVVGVLMHTRWTFGWSGNPHIARCDVWYDIGATLGHQDECEFAPEFTPAELHLRSGNDVNQECYAYDAVRQVRTRLDNNATLWPTAGNVKSLVVDREAAAVRDPYEAVLGGVLSTGRGGIYFRSADGSCIGQYALLRNHGSLGATWGWYLDPWNNNVAGPDRFVDPHHRLRPVSGSFHPRLRTPAPATPRGVLGPFSVFHLTGNQAMVEASMRELAARSEDELAVSTLDPFSSIR